MVNFRCHLANCYSCPILKWGYLSFLVSPSELRNNYVVFSLDFTFPIRPVILPKKIHRLSPLGIFTAAMLLTYIHRMFVQYRTIIDVLWNALCWGFRDVGGSHINLKHRTRYRVSSCNGVPFVA